MILEERNGLIMHHMPLIKHMVYKHSDGSEDRVHDAIVYVAKHLTRYNNGCKLSTWISWLCRGGLKQGGYKSLAEYHSKHVGVQYIRLVENNTPRSALMNKEYVDSRECALNHAICSLDMVEQWLVHQRIWKRRTLKDIADEEGVTVQCVQQRWQKVLRDMRHSVEQYLDDLR